MSCCDDDGTGCTCKIDYEGQVKEAIDYILEITNNQVGVGDKPVSFLIASHREIMNRLDGRNKALAEALNEINRLNRRNFS